MKRQEEIELAMKDAVSETIVASGWGITPRATDLLECAFTKGAEWADKTMLDRACKWLKSVLACGDDYIGDEVVIAYKYETVGEFITAFRQAMKGGTE